MSKRFAVYVPDELAEKWESEIEKSGMSRSEWLQARVSAGRKKFNRDVQPDQSRDELRRKLNDMRNELGRSRDRIETLEEVAHTSERDAILQYLEENTGARYNDIVQHVVNTAHSRVTKILDDMEGDDIEIDEEGRMYKR